ncbi:hypothetical protein C8R45DRAFT_1096200 [Mycena sanguinolenta]|nr:hypothetical protein C8R45DRAFT_1096200 [Mycena sanguinolenta]
MTFKPRSSGVDDIGGEGEHEAQNPAAAQSHHPSSILFPLPSPSARAPSRLDAGAEVEGERDHAALLLYPAPKLRTHRRGASRWSLDHSPSTRASETGVNEPCPPRLLSTMQEEGRVIREETRVVERILSERGATPRRCAATRAVSTANCDGAATQAGPQVFIYDGQGTEDGLACGGDDTSPSSLILCTRSTADLEDEAAQHLQRDPGFPTISCSISLQILARVLISSASPMTGNAPSDVISSMRPGTRVVCASTAGVVHRGKKQHPACPCYCRWSWSRFSGEHCTRSFSTACKKKQRTLRGGAPHDLISTSGAQHDLSNPRCG